MYPADDGKPAYNQPQAAATGFPVNYSSSTTGYSGASSDYHAPPLPPPKPLVDWSTGLCDCFSNGSNCCITCWCPCVTFGRVAEIVDKGSTSCGASGALYTLITCVIGCGCLYSCFYRSKMRQQYMLKESPCWDCMVHCFCELCALCQEHRELQNRGFDMVLGWQGNVEQRNRRVGMNPTAPPPAVEHMSR